MAAQLWSRILVLGAFVVGVGACASGESSTPDASGGAVDATQSVVDATPEKPDARPVPDAQPGSPDAMVPPDAQVLPDASLVDAGPAPDAGATCGALNVPTSIDGGEPTYQRYYGAPPECIISPSGDNVNYDVYKYQLSGPGPHMLTVSTCNMASFDTVLTVYQAAGGAANAFDPLNACNNRVAYNDDDATNCSGNSSLLTATGLEAGEVTIVVAPFSTGTTGTYTVDISSTTCVGN